MQDFWHEDDVDRNDREVEEVKCSDDKCHSVILVFRFVNDKSSAKDIMKGAFFWMKEHHKKADKGKDRHNEKKQAHGKLPQCCLLMCLVVYNDEMGHLLSGCLRAFMPKYQGDERPQRDSKKGNVRVGFLCRLYPFDSIHKARLMLHRVVAKYKIYQQTDGNTDHKDINA